MVAMVARAHLVEPKPKLAAAAERNRVARAELVQRVRARPGVHAPLRVRAEQERLARAEVVRGDVPRQRRVTAEEVAVGVQDDEERRARLV